MASTAPLSASGKLFFGSLCASTFGLGCWQTQRFFEKQELMKQRQEELAMDPSSITQEGKWRRRMAQGTFRHSKEILIGPRGPPPGAMADTGPSSGRSGGGMSSSPQGYYIVTPLDTMDGSMVLINRGWIPRRFVSKDSTSSWERPSGLVQVVGIPATPEKPRFLTPQHDFTKKPLQLFWMDIAALQQLSGSKDTPLLLTQVASDNKSNGFPVQPRLETVGEFKVTPMIHAGYAVTWFGLAGAGMYMTRKLITRGRG